MTPVDIILWCLAIFAIVATIAIVLFITTLMTFGIMGAIRSYKIRGARQREIPPTTIFSSSIDEQVIDKFKKELYDD